VLFAFHLSFLVHLFVHCWPLYYYIYITYNILYILLFATVKEQGTSVRQSSTQLHDHWAGVTIWRCLSSCITNTAL